MSMFYERGHHAGHPADEMPYALLPKAAVQMMATERGIDLLLPSGGQRSSEELVGEMRKMDTICAQHRFKCPMFVAFRRPGPDLINVEQKTVYSSFAPDGRMQMPPEVFHFRWCSDSYKFPLNPRVSSELVR